MQPFIHELEEVVSDLMIGGVELFLDTPVSCLAAPAITDKKVVDPDPRFKRR